MPNYEVSMERDCVDIDLLRDTDSLPQILRNLNTTTPFVCTCEGIMAAQCLLKIGQTSGEIVNYAYIQEEGCREMLLYVMDFCRVKGLEYLEIGCGNADLFLLSMLQRIGFRIIEVWSDHLMNESKIANVKNSILNRDMIRFRANLNESTLTTVN